MKSITCYYQLASTTMDPCTMTKSFRTEARRTWLCERCGHPLERHSFDLSIQEDRPDNTPLNMAYGCRVGIARKEFLFAFGEDIVLQDLYLGNLYGPDGCLLKDWVTFVGHHQIIVRGSKDAAYRRCSQCGKNIYFAMDDLYLYPQPARSVSMFDAGSGCLVVTDKLIGRVKLNKWQKLECKKLPVLNTPKDGFVELISV